MENIFVEFLPPWVETGLQPAFYDKESGTVLQQTARMYARVNMLIRMFNKLSKQTKNEIERFEEQTNTEIERVEEQTNTEIERFERVTNETVNDYIEKFNQLHDYVYDYFDNLDVQEEINNKLDDMVEQGTLQEIIADYLNSKAVFGYDTVSDMKSSTNLINGSYAETLGYHQKGDRGGALYKIRTITDQDVVDEGFIVAMNDASLVAELIIGENLAPEMLGAYGDGVNDDTDIIEKIITKNIDVHGDGVYNVDNLTIGFVQIPEDTPQKISNVYLHKIVSTANNAVCLRGCVNFTFDYIENTVGNGIAFINNTYDSNIHGTRINAKKNGIYFNTDTENGGYRCWVQYTEFNIKQIVAEEDALHVYNTDRWFNSNRFIDCVFAGDQYGIYLNRSSTGALDENTFIGISLEGSSNGIYLNRTSRTKIESVRTQEVTNTKLKMVGTNMYCDIYIGVSNLAKIDLSEVTGGWGTLIRGVIVDDVNADAIFNEIAINTDSSDTKYYSFITYKLVGQLEKGVIWPEQDGVTVLNYCENHPTPMGNTTGRTKFASKNIYVDHRGNAIINFNSGILQYLGELNLFSDSRSNFTNPVKIQIDGVEVKSLTSACTFRFVNDYRKVIIL